MTLDDPEWPLRVLCFKIHDSSM